MNLTRTEYEERIKIAIYRGASWATNRKEGDKIEDEVRDTLNILEKRSLVTRKEI